VRSFPVATSSTALRMLARRLVQYAARGLDPAHPAWPALMDREVQAIAGEFEALIWAVGCLWAIRVERFIDRSRPQLHCLLMVVGLYVSLRYLLTHLAWYGLAPPQVSAADAAPRELIKLGVFAVVVAVVAAATPGGRPRRTFAGLVFPFVALLAVASAALGSQLNDVLIPNANATTLIILRGPLFGVIVAAILSLPCVLLYRTTSTAAAALALLPAFARAIGAIAMAPADLQRHGAGFGHLWPYVCALIALAIFGAVCNRWLGRIPGEGGTRQGT
jgi:hypothetical protein